MNWINRCIPASGFLGLLLAVTPANADIIAEFNFSGSSVADSGPTSSGGITSVYPAAARRSRK